MGSSLFTSTRPGLVVLGLAACLSVAARVQDDPARESPAGQGQPGVDGVAKAAIPDAARKLGEAQAAGVVPDIFTPEPGFRTLFDGRTLSGWEGRPGYWSVEDGAIIGRTTKENPL